MSAIRHFACLIAGTVAMLVATNSSANDDGAAMQRLERAYRRMHARTTPFPGIYDLSYPGQEDATPILVDGDNRIAANNGNAGWHDAYTRAPLSQEAVRELHTRAITQLPLNNAIRIGLKDRPARLAVLSAIDCVPCQHFEKAMATAGIPYFVFPTSLMPENTPIVEAIWCQQDRANAWRNAMDKHAYPKSVPSQCRYPSREMRVLRAYFSINITPTLLYADGTMGMYRGMDGLQERLRELERKGSAFDVHRPEVPAK
jgi:hypothetical protein